MNILQRGAVTMIKNKLAYLGFLGFLSILSPFTFLGEYSSVALCMFPFFFFFLYAKVEPDELFDLHVQKSAARAFFVGLIITAPILVISFLLVNEAIIRFLFVICFITALSTFIISLEIFERREKKVLQDDITN